MGKPTGFLDHERRGLDYRDKEERVGDWNQVALDVPEDVLREQAVQGCQLLPHTES